MMTWEEQIRVPAKGKDDNTVNVTKTRSFKIPVVISSNKREYKRVAILDTGCRICLTRRSVIRLFLVHLEQPAASSKLASASGTPINTTGTIPLRVRLGDLNVTVCFGIVDDLAVPMLIGTS